MLITGSLDTTIKVWSRHDASLISTLVGHTEPITATKLADAHTLVSSAQDATLRIWDLAKNVCSRILIGHPSSIKSLDIQTHIICSGDILGNVLFWHLETGNLITSLKLVGNGLLIPVDQVKKHHEDITISSIQLDGDRLLIATLQGTLTLFNTCSLDCSTTFAQSLECAATPNFLPHDKSVSICASSPDHTYSAGWCLAGRSDAWRLMCVTSTGVCHVWNHKTGCKLYTLSNDAQGAFTSVVFNDFYILVGTRDGSLSIWEPNA